MKCLKAATWRKLCASYSNEEVSEKGSKLVEDIVTTTYDLNLEIDGKDYQ